jgi:hypothetical protein
LNGSRLFLPIKIKRGIKMADEFNSSDPRLKIALPVMVEWTDKEGRYFKVRTFSDNISFGGICFILDPKQTSINLELGQEVRTLLDRGRLSSMAVIRHITTQDDGMIKVGLELTTPILEWLSRYKFCSPDLLRNIIPTTLSQPERRKK